MIILDPHSSVPPYEQIRAQIAAQIQDGRLPSGVRLPTVRRLADDLGLAVNTVARAYRELERDGAVETRGRRGTFATGSADWATRLVEEAATDFAARIERLNIGTNEALRIVQKA